MHNLPRISLFLTSTLVILFVLHYYIWARLIRDTEIKKPWRIGATLVLILLGLMFPASFILPRFLARAVVAPILWVFYLWMGAALFLTSLLVLADLFKFLAVTVPLAVQGKPLNPERRKFLALVSGGAVLLADIGLSFAGLLGATPAAIQVKRVQVALTRLPKNMEGYRIAQICDIHAGYTIGREYIQTIVQKANALESDLIVITGDMVDESLDELRDQVASLQDLRARDGIFFVTGNHEYYVRDLEEWLAWMKGIGVRVLRNERVTIRKGLDLAGTDDISAHGDGHGQNIPKALEGWDGKRPVILLAHQPRSFSEASGLGVDLQLSGHTHGGQIYPFYYLVALFQPYMAGLYRKGNSQIYVSRGTGYWGPSMRLGAPAEITEIKLTRG
jgi:predicted MPP superfamily phosphohydrolase